MDNKELSFKVLKNQLENAVIKKIGISNFHINCPDDINKVLLVILEYIGVKDELSVGFYPKIDLDGFGGEYYLLFNLRTPCPNSYIAVSNFFKNIEKFNAFLNT